MYTQPRTATHIHKHTDTDTLTHTHIQVQIKHMHTRTNTHTCAHTDTHTPHARTYAPPAVALELGGRWGVALWERPEGSALVPPPQSDSWSCAGVGVDGQLPSSKRVSACVQVCLCVHICVLVHVYKYEVCLCVHICVLVHVYKCACVFISVY